MKIQFQEIQGYAKAQFIVGFAYYNGTAVEQSFTKAREWWVKAAKQGQEHAIKNLKMLDEQEGRTSSSNFTDSQINPRNPLVNYNYCLPNIRPLTCSLWADITAIINIQNANEAPSIGHDMNYIPMIFTGRRKLNENSISGDTRLC